MAIGPWLAVAGALAPKVIGALDQGPERAAKRSRKRRTENWLEGVNLQRDERSQQREEMIAERLGGDMAFGVEGRDKLFQRGLNIEGKQFRQQLADEREAEKQANGWQSWLQPLMGAGIATAGAIGAEMEGDPLEHRRNQLDQTAEEAEHIAAQGLAAASPLASGRRYVGDGVLKDPSTYTGAAHDSDAAYISSQGLGGRNIAEAENDERTRSALYGSRRRMNRHEF